MSNAAATTISLDVGKLTTSAKAAVVKQIEMSVSKGVADRVSQKVVRECVRQLAEDADFQAEMMVLVKQSILAHTKAQIDDSCNLEDAFGYPVANLVNDATSYIAMKGVSEMLGAPAPALPRSMRPKAVKK